MLRYLARKAIRAYQIFLSPFLGQKCRFWPTCSVYAHECFESFGFFRALWRSGKRVAKCHPFHSGGLDPVPGERR